MKILAIETSTKLCSVSLLCKKNITTYFKLCPYNHNKYILHMINKILIVNTTKIKELNIITYSIGPGSFTGMRIGMGITQGLSFQYNIPTIGISTLATMAYGTWQLNKKKKYYLYLMPI